MNLLQGMRRLAIVIALFGLSYEAIVMADRHTYLQVGYLAAADGIRERIVSLDCPANYEGTYRKSFTTPKGNRFEARFCFPTAMGNDESPQVLLPDQVGIVKSFSILSLDAERAMKRYVDKHFHPSAADFAYADRAFGAQRSQEWRGHAEYVGTILLLYIAVLTALGWVLRGFLNIPWYSDRRTTGDAPGVQKSD